LKTFESMELFGPLLKALTQQNYKEPTPIQAQTIPPAIAGQDILGCAQTGTGKTAAFALPILHYLGTEKPRPSANRPTALVLAPTRELAIQISDSFRIYGQHLKFRQALVYGGVSQGSQVNSLRRGVDVLIATPGRLIDLMDQGHIDLRDVEVFVLDEADRMLDMGFLPALKKIMARLPRERQSMFFSATMAPKIRELASQLLFNPFSVNVTPKTPSVKQIKQSVRIVDRQNKVDSLLKLLSAKEVDRAIVFSRTKHGANGLTKKLERAGVRAVAIHGNKSQNARQKALDAFRQKKVTVLVATDVAARGIDIDGITHVINYDMPVEPESYVHRIGRTGRAGADGIAISFCTGDERGELRAIEQLIGETLFVENPEVGFRSAEPARKRPSGPGRPNRGGQGGPNRGGREQANGRGSKRVFGSQGQSRRSKKGKKRSQSSSRQTTSAS
jgi:ATP-dependent RNA helicase RhlE